MFSIGPRGTGKTFLALESVKVWLAGNVFTHLYFVLPDFEDEQHDSYAWLRQYENVTVFESYSSKVGKEILERSDKNSAENRKNPKVPLERYMLFVDDATNDGDKLMRCPYLVKISTSARHKRIHSWFCVHAVAGVIPPKIRYMAGFVFIYPVHREMMKTLYKEFIRFPKDFKNFKEFEAFFEEHVECEEFGCLLINHQYKPHSFNPYVCHWFDRGEDDVEEIEENPQE
ncbi:MAG: ATPase/DNA packaging protein [Flavobacteriaceae bacterium]|nr:ATPase/DNA packaging protein [Flavobacteriaceae bacterium]